MSQNLATTISGR